MGKNGTPCCAHGCSKRSKGKGLGASNRSDSEGSEDEESQRKKQFPRTFHGFPSEPLRRAKWLTAMEKQDWQPTKYSKICSDHFKEKDINRTGQIVLLREDAVPSRFKPFLKYRKKHIRRKKAPIVNDRANNPKIPIDIIYIMEEHKETNFGDTKIEEDIEYNAIYGTTYGSQLTSQLQPTEQVFVEDFPNIEGERTATCEETNFGDTKIGEDIKYNASYDTTYGSRLTSQLQPAEQVRDNSEGERTSTCEKTMSGFSQEVSGSNCYIKLEEDDSLSEDWVEIKEEALNFDTHYDDMCGVQSSSLSPLPETQWNMNEEKPKPKSRKKFPSYDTHSEDMCGVQSPSLLSPSGKRKLSGT